MKKIVFLFFIGILHQYTFGQSDKNISRKNIHQAIPVYIDKNYPAHSTVSYYKEISDDSISYEATFKYQKQIYSLGFDTTGNCIEMEIEIDFNQLPKSVQQLIEQKLELNFLKYKIKKTEEVDVQGVLLYELEIQGKIRNTKYYEYYFDRNGVFIRSEKIQLKTIPSLF